MSNFWNSVILITSSDSERRADRDIGTGFVIHQDEQTTYVLTCAHVVNDVGGEDKVIVGGHPATVEDMGDRYGCDLAVLAIEERLTELPPLKLGAVGEEGRQFFGAGFYTDGTKTCKLAKIRGKLDGIEIIETTKGDRTEAWNLKIDNESENDLKSGYSGSPVIELESGYVVGVISQRTGQGTGLAIFIKALNKVWPEIPTDLFIHSQLEKITIHETVNPPEARILRALINEESGRHLYYYRNNGYYQEYLNKLQEKGLIYERSKHFYLTDNGTKVLKEHLAKFMN